MGMRTKQEPKGTEKRVSAQNKNVNALKSISAQNESMNTRKKR